MPREMKLPELGENVEKGDVIRVLVAKGDVVKKDQPVLELETDKATIEVPASEAGTVTAIRVKAGDKVKVGQVVRIKVDAWSGNLHAEGEEGWSVKEQLAHVAWMPYLATAVAGLGVWFAYLMYAGPLREMPAQIATKYAGVKDLLDAIDFAGLESSASVVVPSRAAWLVLRKDLTVEALGLAAECNRIRDLVAEALQAHPRLFTSMYVNMIRAGEESGTLEIVLLRLADYMESQARLLRTVQAALTYPLVMIVVSVVILTFLLAYVVPQVTKIFTESGRMLPLATRILLGVSSFVASYWWVILLVAAGLFARSFDAIRKVDPGFGHAGGALVWAAFREQRDPLLAIEQLQRRLRELPEVRSLGLASDIHLNALNSTTMDFLVDGVEPPLGRLSHAAGWASIDSSFFDAAGIRLTAGRNFTVFDTDSAPAVAIVNQAFAAGFFPGREAVGQRFRTGEGTVIEIVGVTSTTKVRSLAETPQPFIYRPITQHRATEAWLVARTDGDPERLLVALNRVIRETAPDVFVLQSRTMARHLEIMSLPIKMAASALAVFAVLALVIASVGLYGMVSYSVSQRSREVGIRLSLGANRGSVIRLLLFGGLRLVAIGAAIGLAVAMVSAQLLSGLLVGVPAADPVTFVAVPLVILAVAGVAAYLPARKAGAVEPVAALRAE